ncbi:MAG: HAD family hydrolase [Methanocella sp.]
MIRVVVFDWGDTLMRNHPEFGGPMVTWPLVELVPGVAEALEQISGRYALGVTSNAGHSDAELMGLALKRGGIRHHFQHLFTEHELGTAKPDPVYFGELLRRVEAGAAETVMVGNDYRYDIEPAKFAGLRTVWYRPVPGTGLAPAADAVIQSFTDLLAALQRLEAG